MVTHGINRNVFKIIDTATPGVKGIDEEWLAEDAEIVTSNDNIGATVVLDFSYSVSSVIEYTLNGVTWIEFNSGVALVGDQNIHLRVQNGDQINLRAKTGGTLNRLIVGEV